jgi:hypothetical protein
MKTHGSGIELERTKTGVKISLEGKSIEFSASDAKWLSRNLPIILKCASGEKMLDTFKKT